MENTISKITADELTVALGAFVNVFGDRLTKQKRIEVKNLLNRAHSELYPSLYSMRPYPELEKIETN